MDIKKYRKKSFLGGAIFLLGIFICGFNMKTPIFFFIGLALLIIGWFIFSHFHTQIAIYKLREYTKEYMQNIKK